MASPQSPHVVRTPGASNWNIIFIECRCDCWWFRNSFIDPPCGDGKVCREWVWYNKVSSSHRNHSVLSQGRHQLSLLSSVITKYWDHKYWGEIASLCWRVADVFSPWLRRQYTSDTSSQTLFSTHHLLIRWWDPADSGQWQARDGYDMCDTLTWQWQCDGLQLVKF